mmetsp:Transcript_38012/g.57865  ORF Transcript_38012/g.57865 Transcript_38012/m.57865 type:complete len:169 (-) Transcript_38012:764-1270(-)
MIYQIFRAKRETPSQSIFCKHMDNWTLGWFHLFSFIKDLSIMMHPLGKNMFHMARTDDVAEAAMKVRQSIGPNQILTGVGFSMGGIILSNYVARSGESCQLHAAIAVSGGLDLREQVNSHRSQRLWQPVMARRLLRENLIGKYGFKYKEHLKDEEYLNLLRAQDATVS